MVYLVFLFFGCILLSVYDEKYSKLKYWQSVLILLPLLVSWVLIIGGQYEVGTDYRTYMSLFDGSRIDLYERKSELGFYYFVTIFQYLGIHSQGLFFIFAFFYFLLYFKISRNLTIQNHVLFFFIFITTSTLFHNQMNILRQSCSIYLVTLGLIDLLKGNNKKFFLWVLLASTFHFSSLVILALYFLRFIRLNISSLYLLLIISAISPFISIDSWIRDIIILIPNYAHYSDSVYVGEVGIIDKLTKLSLLPIYFLSLGILKKHELSSLEFKLFQMGIITYFLRMLFLVSSISSRIGYYFLITSTLPVFYYLVILKQRKDYLYLFICFYLLLFYLVKIILMPKNEYLYSSIYKFLF